ncbi:MAG TPA: PUA domain-containing protein, partial [archaeon]|nr:PUA domain-containing protein [archaeon]
FAIASGSALYTGGISKLSNNINPEELVAIITLKGELVALAKSVMKSEEMMRKKGLAAKTDSVIISRDVYPKM